MADRLLLCRAAPLSGQGQGVSDRGDMKNDMSPKIPAHMGLGVTKKALFGRAAAILMTSSSLFVRGEKNEKTGRRENVSRQAFKETDFLSG